MTESNFGNESAQRTAAGCRDLLDKAIQRILADQHRIRRLEKELEKPTELDDAYDYIIVGGGTAGCVIANKLSQNPGVSVLVLEAGGDDRDIPEIRVPGFCGALQRSSIDWTFSSVPQGKTDACLGLNDTRMLVSRGKILGGSSSLNFMLYDRGCRGDFDYWSKELGCTGWSAEEVMPIFTNLEGCLEKDTERSQFNTEGPLKLRYVPTTSIREPFLKACAESGYTIHDHLHFDDDDLKGFSVCLSATNEDSLRVNSAEAFLRPVQFKPNLKVQTHAHVARVLINSEQVATGVKFFDTESPFGMPPCRTIYARRGVIVCAGALQSPQILMLSGVGPKDHLEEVGIRCKVDLPVGRNLLDHISTLLEFNTTLPTMRAEDAHLPETRAEMLFDGEGMLAGSGFDVQGWLDSGFRPKLEEYSKPDLRVFTFVGCARSGSQMFMKPHFNISKKFDIVNPEDYAGKFQFAAGVGLMHPQSSGTITLASADPFDKPVIDPCYLSHEDDIKSLIRGLEAVVEISKTNAFQSFAEPIKPPKSCPYEFGTAAHLEWMARHLVMTLNHFCGTCRMGLADGAGSVVTPDLRVIGVKGLRVADCSIMPTQTSGNIQSVAYMIGEKAAQLIIKSGKLTQRA
eukprot:403594_1